MDHGKLGDENDGDKLGVKTTGEKVR